MLFDQLTDRESLRDLIVIIKAHRNKCHHLGFGKHVTKSNLAKANQNQDCRISEEFACFLVVEARSNQITDIFKLGAAYMRLIQKPSIFVYQCFSEPSSANVKVASESTRYMT